MNVNNENIINIKDLKKNYFQARESIRKSFFSNYSGIKNNKQNSDLIDNEQKNLPGTRVDEGVERPMNAKCDLGGPGRALGGPRAPRRWISMRAF